MFNSRPLPKRRAWRLKMLCIGAAVLTGVGRDSGQAGVSQSGLGVAAAVLAASAALLSWGAQAWGAASGFSRVR